MLCGVGGAVVLTSTYVSALELGFEASVTVESSDNVESAQAEFEESGQLGYGAIGVYGEQRGRVVQGAFSANIETEKTLSDSDDDFDALTSFIGAVNVGITPQSVNWYFGDILGVVRPDNADQTVEVRDLPRRNVFVTGPSIDFNTGSFSSASTRLLYVHQSDEEGELASLLNFSAEWRNQTQRGNTFGVRLGDIYTDNSEVLNEADFNRLSAAAFWARERGRNSITASLGATRYTTEGDSVAGLNAGLSFTHLLGPAESYTIALSRDLRDQTLNTIESLIDDGSGEEPTDSGFFEETSLTASYSLQANNSTYEFGIGASMSDYKSLGSNVNVNLADQVRPFLYGVWARDYSPRLRSELSVNYEQIDFDNLIDETSSLSVRAMLAYRLSRSFSAEVGYIFDQADGLRTSIDNGQSTTQDIDVVENSARVTLRWAPPSRASQALTIELKSLLN